MNAESSTWLVCYDVSCNRRRTKIARLLAGFGERLQRSVFETVWENRLVDHLTGQLRDLLEEGDQLMLCPVCRTCGGKMIVLGRAITRVASRKWRALVV